MNERALGWSGVGVFAAIWIVCLTRQAPRIAAEIHKNGSEALTAAGITSTGLSVSGRAVHWRGVVDDAAGIVQIGEILEAVPGVRTVRVSPLPRTPSAAEVLERRLGQFLAIHPIRFTSSSAELIPETRQSLDIVADVLAGEPDADIVIEGHTDTRGDPRQNLQLSQDRADAVRRHLILHGIAPDRLYARGFGDTAPIADNSTAAGRRANRRIVFRVKE